MRVFSRYTTPFFGAKYTTPFSRPKNGSNALIVFCKTPSARKQSLPPPYGASHNVVEGLMVPLMTTRSSTATATSNAIPQSLSSHCIIIQIPYKPPPHDFPFDRSNFIFLNSADSQLSLYTLYSLLHFEFSSFLLLSPFPFFTIPPCCWLTGHIRQNRPFQINNKCVKCAKLPVGPTPPFVRRVCIECSL